MQNRPKYLCNHEEHEHFKKEQAKKSKEKDYAEKKR